MFWSSGEPRRSASVCWWGYFDRREPVPEAMHAAYVKLLREYAVIGGMPEVVSSFLDHGNYAEVQTLQQKLIAYSANTSKRMARRVGV